MVGLNLTGEDVKIHKIKKSQICNKSVAFVISKPSSVISVYSNGGKYENREESLKVCIVHHIPDT